MSLAEIEAELGKLTPDELRQLALKSWSVLVQKERRTGAASECDEEDPQLLAALDEAVARAGATKGQGHTPDEVRSRIRQWTSR